MSHEDHSHQPPPPQYQYIYTWDFKVMEVSPTFTFIQFPFYLICDPLNLDKWRKVWKFKWANGVNNLSIGIDHWHIRKWIFNVLFPFCQKVGNSRLSSFWVILPLLQKTHVRNSLYTFPRKTIQRVSWGGKALFIVFIGGAKWRHAVSFMPEFLSVSEMARVNEAWTSFTPGARPSLRSCNLSRPKPRWSPL